MGPATVLTTVVASGNPSDSRLPTVVVFRCRPSGSAGPAPSGEPCPPIRLAVSMPAPDDCFAHPKMQNPGRMPLKALAAPGN